MIEKNGGRKEKCCCLDVKKINKRSFTHKKKKNKLSLMKNTVGEFSVE